jgi:hypothetical protein
MLYMSQRDLYFKLPDTVAGAQRAAQSMNLGHAEYAPPPHSWTWWLTTVLLLNLQLWEWVWNMVKTQLQQVAGGG